MEKRNNFFLYHEKWRHTRTHEIINLFYETNLMCGISLHLFQVKRFIKDQTKFLHSFRSIFRPWGLKSVELQAKLEKFQGCSAGLLLFDREKVNSEIVELLWSIAGSVEFVLHFGPKS